MRTVKDMGCTWNGLKDFPHVKSALLDDCKMLRDEANSKEGHLGDRVASLHIIQDSIQLKIDVLSREFQKQKEEEKKLIPANNIVSEHELDSVKEKEEKQMKAEIQQIVITTKEIDVLDTAKNKRQLNYAKTVFRGLSELVEEYNDIIARLVIYSKENKPAVSVCCNANVSINGMGTTHYYVCDTCKQPCDIK